MYSFLLAHLISKDGPDLCSNSGSNRSSCNTTRLCASNHISICGPSRFIEVLGKLYTQMKSWMAGFEEELTRSFSTSSLSNYYYNTVRFDGMQEFLSYNRVSLQKSECEKHNYV